jgi:hypothetical protein
MNPTNTGYATVRPLYVTTRFKCSETINWHGSKEYEKVLADFKRDFRNAIFIPQESIKVAKVLVSHNCSVHKYKTITPDLEIEVSGPEAIVDVYGKKELYPSFLGFAYQVLFDVTDIGQRHVLFVTKEQYLKGLISEDLKSEFLKNPELDYYFLVTQHCEELPVSRGLVNPVDVPISPEIWCLTKLLQRISAEGYSVKIPGMFGNSCTMVGDNRKAVKFNGMFPKGLTNQNAAHDETRLA